MKILERLFGRKKRKVVAWEKPTPKIHHTIVPEQFEKDFPYWDKPNNEIIRIK